MISKDRELGEHQPPITGSTLAEDEAGVVMASHEKFPIWSEFHDKRALEGWTIVGCLHASTGQLYRNHRLRLSFCPA
jgi:hypothetical protein